MIGGESQNLTLGDSSTIADQQIHALYQKSLELQLYKGRYRPKTKEEEFEVKNE